MQRGQKISAWIANLEAAARTDVRIVCYNFMPVVDWCRTDLDYETRTGSTAMRFDQRRFAVFELCILRRPGAERDYSSEERADARALHAQMSEAEVVELTATLLLPCLVRRPSHLRFQHFATGSTNIEAST